MADTTLLRHSDVTAAVDDRHWRVLLQSLRATFSTPDFTTAAAFVARIAAAADEANHHPDVVLRWGQVTVTTSSHDAGGLTQRDVDLAATVTAHRRRARGDRRRRRSARCSRSPSTPSTSPRSARSGRRSSGYDVHDDDDLVDPAGIGPSIWFQQMDAPRPQRNRIHFDVIVAHDQAEARVAAAIAAGGHLVSDERAPAFWVLADAEGNEVCVCTWQARSNS